jgi:hypothetical protein
MFVRTFQPLDTSHHLLKPDFTCICTLEPEIFSVNESWVLDTSQIKSEHRDMSILFSYPKSCTRPVKFSIKGLQENDHLEVDLLRMIDGRGWRLQWKFRY